MAKPHTPRNFDKEQSKLQKLAHENQQLKKEVKVLKKRVQELSNKYSKLDGLVQDQYQEVVSEDDALKNQWKCNACKKDFLRLVILNRLDGPHYYRACGSCINRTKIKRYTPDVKGIK